MGLLEAIIISVIAASTPLLLAAAGELVVERAGVLNLGIEGMMIMGAACGCGRLSHRIGLHRRDLRNACRCRHVGELRRADPGARSQPGRRRPRAHHFRHRPVGAHRGDFVGERIEAAPHLDIPFLTDIPVIGKILFGQDAFVSHRSHWSSASGGSCTAPAPAWCCGRSAMATPPPMRSAITCCKFGPSRCRSAAPARALPAPTCRSPTPRSSCPA